MTKTPEEAPTNTEAPAVLTQAEIDKIEAAEQKELAEESTKPSKPLTRDEIRAKIFGAKPTEVLETLFGAPISIHQPPLGIILSKRADDQTNQVVSMLTDYTFVPGTDEKVFEAADVDSIMAIPFGPDMKRYIDAMNKLLGVDAGEVKAGVDAAMKKA